jgi:Holliday junction DNA helicase RuvA
MATATRRDASQSPRLALAMLATFSPDGLRRAVAAEDLTALTSVPGIGPKGAQRIVLELAGRLGSPGEGGQAAAAGSGGAGLVGRLVGVAALTWRDQVRTGLVNLGWQVRDADQAIALIEPELLAAGQAGEPGADGGADSGNGSAGSGAAGSAGEVDVAWALRAALRVLGRP